MPKKTTLRSLLLFIIFTVLVIFTTKLYLDSEGKARHYEFLQEVISKAGICNPSKEQIVQKMDSPGFVRDIGRPMRKESPEYEVVMATLKKMNAAKVKQTDPGLIELIRKYFIDPPSDEDYNLKHPTVRDPSHGQAPFVDKMLDYKMSGFFVECGGYDGEDASNTLYFERFRNWTGLLIEPDPVKYQQLRAKKRKSFSVNACLSTTPYPVEVTFNPANQRGRIQEEADQQAWIKSEGIAHTTIKAQCFPLVSILRALGQKHIDYFSLDIEGDELKVLKTIPLNEFDIRMFSIEVKHSTAKNNELKNYFQSFRYRSIMYMVGHMVEDVFYRKD